MSSTFEQVRSRSPVAVCWAAVSVTIFLVAHTAGPAIAMQLVLSPPDVLGGGHVWQLLTYIFFPPGPIGLLLTGGFILYVSWHLEPVLGAQRTILLYLVVAVGSGLTYILLVPNVQYRAVAVTLSDLYNIELGTPSAVDPRISWDRYGYCSATVLTSCDSFIGSERTWMANFEIDVVPEPGTGLLLMTGMLGLALRHKPRRIALRGANPANRLPEPSAQR